jgi:hypothetical protein
LIKVWGSGQLGTDVLEPGEPLPTEGAMAVVLESAEHFDRACSTGLVAADTRVFVPGASDSTEDPDGPVVLGYDGSLSDPGGDVQIGTQFFLQTQDYGTSEYLSLIGATLVKVVDGRDFDAYLADADTALAEGAFPDFATHPLVRLCDVAALGGPIGVDGPRLRLYVGADGVISTSTAGAPLGELGDDLAALEETWSKINAESALPCAVGLARAVEEDVRVAGLRERPWIGRYHGALGAVRALRARNIGDGRDIRVSGFGGRMLRELEDVAQPRDLRRDEAPLLLWTGEDAYVHSPATERVFRVPLPAAARVERLLVHGSPEAAAGADDLDQLIRVRDYFAGAGIPLCERTAGSGE